MRILYALLCEHAESRPDGRLDVHGVFHELYAPGFPAKQDHLVLALAIEWDIEEPGRQEFSIDLIDPTGSPALTIRGHTDVMTARPGRPPPRTLLLLPVEGVVFPEAGTYFFRMESSGGTIPVAPLHLIENPMGGELGALLT